MLVSFFLYSFTHTNTFSHIVLQRDRCLLVLFVSIKLHQWKLNSSIAHRVFSCLCIQTVEGATGDEQAPSWSWCDHIICFSFPSLHSLHWISFCASAAVTVLSSYMLLAAQKHQFWRTLAAYAHTAPSFVRPAFSAEIYLILIVHIFSSFFLNVWVE